MVSSVFAAGISGLQSAQNRLFVSANNTANQFSTTRQVDGETVNEPYQPLEVVNSSQAEGGVRSTIVEPDAPPLVVYDPQNTSADAEGLVELPNTDQLDSTLNRLLAENQFRANLNLIEAADETLGDLLDSLE